MSWCAVFVALATASSMSCDDGAGTGGAGPGTSTASGSQTSTSASNATTSSGTTESGSSGVTAAPHLGAHGLAFYGYASLGAGSRPFQNIHQPIGDLRPDPARGIERGQRVTEIMKQSQYSPLNVGQMAVSLFAANEGFLDDIAVDKIRDFEEGLQGYIKSEHGQLLDQINQSGDYNDDLQKSLSEAVTQYKATHTW